MQAGKWDAAADLFRKGLALDPEARSWDMAWAWRCIGRATTTPRRQFEAVLRRSPDHLETRFNFAVLLAQQNRYRDALAQFAAVAKQDPGRADVQVGQAEMLRNLGDLNASVLHWRRAVEIDPANAGAWSEGAKALIALKRYREARDWLEAARKNHPADVELSALSAHLSAVSGKQTEVTERTDKQRSNGERSPFSREGAYHATSLLRDFLTRLRRLQALVRLRLANQGVSIRVLNRLHSEIDIEIRPIQVVRARKLDVRDFSNRRLSEPRKLLECDEQLPLADEQPKTERRNVSDFHQGSACATRRGFH